MCIICLNFIHIYIKSKENNINSKQIVDKLMILLYEDKQFTYMSHKIYAIQRINYELRYMNYICALHTAKITA